MGTVSNTIFLGTAPAQWFFLLFLILMNAFIWTTHKRLGFQIFYVTLLSLTIAFVLVMQLPYIYTRSDTILITNPLTQSITTFFLLFIPLVKNRVQLIICVLIPLGTGVYLLLQDISLISLLNALLIGAFIVYAYYRSLDWLSGVPESYLISLAVLLPVFLGGILYPNFSFMFLPGLMLGIGVGIMMELLKIQVDISKLTFYQRIATIFIGSTGILLLIFFNDLIGNITVFDNLIFGCLLGIWMTLIVPMLLVAINIYPKKTEMKF